jgi:hypothetical protein
MKDVISPLQTTGKGWNKGGNQLPHLNYKNNISIEDTSSTALR